MLTQGLLPKLISLLQSAYIPNKDIHDNVLTAHKLFPILKENKNFGYMAVKLDMGKAYDRLK